MTYSELKTAIAFCANGVASDMAIPAQGAIKWLSNYFSNDDEDQTLVGDGVTTSFAKPLQTQSIFSVLVGSDLAERIALDDGDRLEIAGDYSLTRYYETADSLVFLVAPPAGSVITILRAKSFTIPSADSDVLDVPDRLHDLLVAASVVRVFRRMVSIVATASEDLPDAKLDEIRRALDSWNKQVSEELKRL